MTLATSIDLRPLASSGKMWSGMLASGALHVGIALFLIVGVPQLFRPEPAQLTMPVDIVNLDELSELASLPAEQIGPVESAEESKPVEEVDEVARPQQAAAQPAPAVQPTPPAPSEAPAPEPAVQPETAAVPPAPAATAEAPPPPAAQPEPTPARPAPAEPLPAEAAPAEPVQPTPELAAVEPEPQAPPPEPQPAEAAETPQESAEPVPQPEEAAEPSEEQPLMAGVLPLPTPPRPEDAPKPEPQPEAQAAQPSPPPTPVRSQEPPKEQPTDDLLAGVLRNVDKNLKPSVTEQQQQAARSTAEVTQSMDLTRRAAALGQMIRGQMQRCWRIDPGARSAERLRVSVRVRLKPDGTLMAPPEFQNVGQLADNAYYRAAAESARRAILECQPFRLPQEDYNLWQDLVLNFDPREMF